MWLCSQSKQAYHHIHRESPLITGSAIRERQLKSVLLSRFISSPLTYIQWLSSKSVELAFGRSWVQFPAGFQIFLQIPFSQKATSANFSGPFSIGNKDPELLCIYSLHLQLWTDQFHLQYCIQTKILSCKHPRDFCF